MVYSVYFVSVNLKFLNKYECHIIFSFHIKYAWNF